MKRKASQVEIVDSVESELYSTVRAIITRARSAVYVAANTAMVEAYWNVGREIVAKQGGKAKAKYGEGLVKGLAVKLTAEFGDGFTEANLRYMRLVYLAFPNRHTLCDKLSWSHYRTLVKVENPDARQYYMEECAKSGWSVRILQRQIASLYYERLLRHKANPKSLQALINPTEGPAPKSIPSIIIPQTTPFAIGGDFAASGLKVRSLMFYSKPKTADEARIICEHLLKAW